MVDAVLCLVGSVPIEESRAAQRRARRCRCDADMTRNSTEIGAAAPKKDRAPAIELAPVVTSDVVRLFAGALVALTVGLSIIDVWQLAFIGPGDLRAGILAASVTIPLHIRHLIYGVRGDRPPAGTWTLAIMATATFAGVFMGGTAFSREFAPLAVSIFIVVPGAWAFVLVGVLVIASVVIAGPVWYATIATPMPGFYVVFVIIWRTTTQIIPLRLLTLLRALDSMSQGLEARAVVQARLHIDSELRSNVGSVLQSIVARAERARKMVKTDPTGAIAELRQLAGESRGALAEARRVVAGYRVSSVRAELDAATALLEASGAAVRVVVADGITLDAPDTQARAIIRAALAEALRGEPRTSYRVVVSRDDGGRLCVGVAGDDGAEGGTSRRS
jgi:two-component system, NarL family, sensor histidine kinase DesK